MAIKKACFDCKGEMKKPDPIHSYDFNTDGWVPFYCINCGLCSDSDFITEILSHRFIKRVLQIICKDGLKRDYVFKAELFELLKETSFYNIRALADQIVLQCHGRGYSITTDHILEKINSDFT